MNKITRPHSVFWSSHLTGLLFPVIKLYNFQIWSDSLTNYCVALVKLIQDAEKEMWSQEENLLVGVCHCKKKKILNG